MTAATSSTACGATGEHLSARMHCWVLAAMGAVGSIADTLLSTRLWVLAWPSLLACCMHPFSSGPHPCRHREINAHLLLEGQPRVVQARPGLRLGWGGVDAAAEPGAVAARAAICMANPPTPHMLRQ